MLTRVSRWLTLLEQGLMLTALAGMQIAVLVAIVSRPLGWQVPWVTPLLLALLIVATFSGAALATAQRKHITMDLLGRVLPPRARAGLSAMVAALGCTICSGLTWVGKTWVQTNMEFDDPISLTLKVPDWYLQAVVPIGFGLCAVHFLIAMIQDGRAAITGDLSQVTAAAAGAAHGVVIPS